MAKEKKSISKEKRGVLVLLSGTGPQDMIKLRRDATLFGREKGDIIIEDNEISSTHCQIQTIGDDYHIFDMNSTNGTFVNNERIVKAKLSPGDIVMLGQSSFRFMLKEEEDIRHITTIFKSPTKSAPDSKTSVVDTLIESELRSTQTFNVIIDVTYEDNATEKISLKQRVLFIGRASSFGRFDQDPELSRKHMMIKVNDNGEIFVEDLGSTNGSFLNGRKITGMHLVRPTDEIKVGSNRLKISLKR